MRNIKSTVRSLWLLRPLGGGQLQLCWSIRLNFLCLGSLPAFFRLNCQTAPTPTNYRDNFPVFYKVKIFIYILNIFYVFIYLYFMIFPWSWVHVLEFKLLVKSGFCIIAFLSFEESLQCIKVIISQMCRLSQLLVNAVCNSCLYPALHTGVIFLR